MSFGKRLRGSRKLKGLTQKQLADLIGAKHNSVSDWENDKNKPDPDTIELLCGVLDITPNYLLASNSSDFSPKEKLFINQYRELDNRGREIVEMLLQKEFENSKKLTVNPRQARYVNYYYRLASAGTGQIIFDTPPTKSIEIPDIPEYKKVDYAIEVNGNSMEPLYSNGDTLLVHMTNDVEIGQIGIFQIDGQCYVKKRGENELISVNKDCDNIPLNETASCMGQVIDKL